MAQTQVEPSAEVFHGRAVTKRKIGLYAANDLPFDGDLEFGDWVLITVQGRVGGFEIDETKAGVAVKAKVTVRHAEIAAIAPPDSDQLALWDAKGKISPELAELAEQAVPDRTAVLEGSGMDPWDQLD